METKNTNIKEESALAKLKKFLPLLKNKQN